MYSNNHTKTIVVAFLVAAFAVGGVLYAIVFSAWGLKTIAFIGICIVLSFLAFKMAINNQYSAYSGTVTITKAKLEGVETENSGRVVTYFLVFPNGERVIYHKGRSCLKIPQGTPYYLVSSIAYDAIIHQAFRCSEYTLCPEFEQIYRNSRNNKEETPI